MFTNKFKILSSENKLIINEIVNNCHFLKFNIINENTKNLFEQLISLYKTLDYYNEIFKQKFKKLVSQEFERGNPVGGLKELGTSNETGTEVTFFPDSEIFDTVDFEFDVLNSRIRELAFLNKGIKITIADDRTNKEEIYQYDGGIKSFVEHLNKSKNTIK